MEDFLPQRLQEEAHLESFQKIQSLVEARSFALALFRELCEKYFIQSRESEDKALQKKMIETGGYCVEFMDVCSQILFITIHLEQETFVNLTEQQISWGKSETVIVFCKKMINDMKEEIITANFSVDPIKNAIKLYKELFGKIATEFTFRKEEEPEEKAK